MMTKKANPTLEGQLLEYLESASDDKSEVMWNVLQHLRARQRGETIENPTIEGRIAEYFETAPLEKAEVLFNLVELKLGKRTEQEAGEAAAAPEEPNPSPARPKRARSESKGKAKDAAPQAGPASEPAQPGKASAVSRVPEARVIEVPMKEPVIVPDQDLAAPDASTPELDDLPPEISDDFSADLPLAELDGSVTAEVDVA